MTTTNKAMKSCLVEFVNLLNDKSFLKTAGKRLHGEREILVALKFFLRGRYKNTNPEEKILLGSGKTGRIDFLRFGSSHRGGGPTKNKAAQSAVSRAK
jgi:hypothetical protein